MRSSRESEILALVEQRRSVKEIMRQFAIIAATVACCQGRRVFAFTRTGDVAAQDFAHSLGAAWGATGRDAEEFLASAPEAGIRTETVTYPLDRANAALGDQRNGALQGAVVLVP